jgi:hypothetical protein
MYDPGAAEASTLIVALAVPPTPVAGVKPESVTGAGGCMSVMAISTTTPSTSEAVTVVDALAPSYAIKALPQLATTGAF